MAGAGEIVDINGKWKNELGSHVNFIQEGQSISGEYCTAVSTRPLESETFPLSGNIGTGSPTSIGFAVTFQGKKEKDKSSTAWSGEYRVVDGKPTIYTTWILTKAEEDAKKMWSSTTIGKDVFTRDSEIVDISGKWQNELGSQVVFKQEGQSISGEYSTTVSRYPLVKSKFPLNGNIGTGSPTSISFVVTYQGKKEEDKSTCGWSGQYRIVEGKPTIYSTWALTKANEDVDKMWSSTTVGEDVFTPDSTDIMSG